METIQPLGCTPKPPQEAELQGLQGPITIPELLLQKIWAHKDFFTNKLFSLSQKKIQITNPGRWNQFEGPDFKDAKIIIDNQRTVGDIEIHFQANHWFDHHHHLNPNFSKVILHVTLFHPNSNHPPAFTSLGSCPETLVLLPYLKQSLEEYTLEHALLTLQNRSNTEFLQAFLHKPDLEIQHLLRQKALLRWQQKLTFALSRLQYNTFEDSCHQMALETLGYRRNRAPMHSIATNFPLYSLFQDPPTIDYLFSSQKDNWKLAKLRPANHPKKRLQQYLNLVIKNPQWPTQWLNYAQTLPHSRSPSNTSSYRKNFRLPQLHSSINQILANSFPGTRFNTLIIDALLPLASAHLNIDLFNLWFHWYPGDVPSTVSSFLSPTNLISPHQPSCNGFNQSILQLFIESNFI